MLYHLEEQTTGDERRDDWSFWAVDTGSATGEDDEWSKHHQLPRPLGKGPTHTQGGKMEKKNMNPDT